MSPHHDTETHSLSCSPVGWIFATHYHKDVEKESPVNPKRCNETSIGHALNK